MNRRRYLLLFLLATLSACASKNETPIEYYYLPHSLYEPPLQETGAIRVEVELNSALATSSFVVGVDTGSGENAVVLSARNLWAEDLGNAIRNNLSNKLNLLGEKTGQSFTIYGHDFPRLHVVIEKFQGNTRGPVQISGYASFFLRGKKAPQSFAFKASAPQYDAGYSALAASLDKALDKVAKQIADTLRLNP